MLPGLTSDNYGQKNPDDSMPLRDLALFLLEGYKMFLLIMLLSVLAAFVQIATSKVKYVVSMTIAPAESYGNTESNARSPLQALGKIGIGSLTSGFSDNKVAHFSVVMYSRKLAQKLFEREEIQELIFESNGASVSIKPDGFVFSSKALLKKSLGLPEWTPPGPASIQQYLRENIQLDTIEEGAFYQIYLESEDVHGALMLLQTLLLESDKIIRSDAHDKTTERIKFLREKLRDVQIQGYRSVIINLLETEEQKQMLLVADTLFSVDLTDPPNSSLYPISPRPRLLLMLYFMLGMCVFILIRLRQYRSKVAPGEPVV